MSLNEKEEFLNLIKRSYNSTYNKDKEISEYLFHVYMDVTKKKKNYKIIASRMQGYLSRYVLKNSNNPSKDIIKLTEKVNKISQSYNSMSSVITWLPFK